MLDSKKRVYAFDFDGVIAEYDGFKGDDIFGEPNNDIVKVIRELKRLGHTVITYSTRDAAYLKRYCEEHNIPIDYYNDNPNLYGRNRGKPIAHVYIDDRCINYHGQSTEELLQEIKTFNVQSD